MSKTRKACKIIKAIKTLILFESLVNILDMSHYQSRKFHFYNNGFYYSMIYLKYIAAKVDLGLFIYRWKP